MALVLADRVQETSTSTGTGSFTLNGAVTGYQSFAVIGNGNTTFYTIADQGGANWEVGIGTYTSSGTSLSRDTVLASSNSGSLVTFTAGTKTVFVTYPSEKSVNLNAAGNVSALGTVSSGTWQGTTVGVAYGGTGVTASSGANSVVLRDANQNVSANNFLNGYTAVTAAGGTTVLTAASAYYQRLSGSTTQTFQLPDATTCVLGQAWVFDNDSSGTLTVVDNASGVVDTIPSGGYGYIFAESISTSAGSWGKYALIPGSYDFNTSTANFGGATITNATYQGNTVQPAYGGTGLTTFTASNNALYSTGASTLTAGTLPVLAGGTGVTTSTGSGNVVLSTSPTLVTPALGTPSSVNLTNATNVPVNQATGTLAIGNGGTGQTTASAAFNALSPITSTGDLIVGSGVNTASRLGIGSTGQVLTVSGGTATWSTPSTGGGTITTTDFTATAGQTTFTVTYTVGAVEVYQNGAKLAVADFTATNGTSIVLATGAAAGDLIEVVTFSTLNLYSTITYDDFSGDGTTTVFTMSAVPANSASLLVAISGVVQDPGTYTVSSTTLTFGTAPPSGSSNISVRYLGVASVGTVGSFSGGTTGLTPSSATTGAVVLGGTLNVANGGTGTTTSTGSGNVVLSNSPTLVTPALGTPSSATLTNATGLPLSTGVTGTLPVANGGTGVTTSTGSGNNVLSTSPTLVTPVLGTPSSGTLTNCTGLPLSTGVTGTLPVANGGSGTTLAFSAYNNTSQSVSGSTFTKCTCNIEEFDVGSCYDNSTNYRFTPTVAGYYKFSGGLGIATTQTGLLIAFYKNGSNFKQAGNTGNASTSQSNGSALIYCNGSTDYVEMYVLINTGQNLAPQSYLTYFQGVLVRAA